MLAKRQKGMRAKYKNRGKKKAESFFYGLKLSIY